MSQDEAPPMMAEGQDRDRIMALVNTMRLMLCDHFDDPREAMSLGMCAAMILAGAQYGTAIAIGIESGQRPRMRQILKMLERNFKSGIDISLRHASRVAQEQGSQQ